MIRGFLQLAGIAALPALTLCGIWFSVVEHYHVPDTPITRALVEDSRSLPDDALLDELSSFYFMSTLATLDESTTVAAAERLLERGEFALPGAPPQRVQLPFDSADLDQGPVVWQLQQASLFIPRLLAKAYRVSGRDEFLLAARDAMLALASHDRRALLPKGRFWNDHAIAERPMALADFWAVYRTHPSFDVEAGTEILAFAARTGSLLADPSHFTVSTNHGVMQNLALWHLCLAFPRLPDAPRLRRLSLERLREQMDFYVDRQGVVLEHSAGYQAVGIQLLSMAFRQMSLLGMAVPSDWSGRFERSQDVFAHLRRPDASLPMFGDTSDFDHPDGPPVTTRDAAGRYGPLRARGRWNPRRARSWFPTAGYAIWWDGLEHWPDARGLSQTVVAWSNYPGHAHKHADEASVLLWAHGETWWSNVGYWPYGTPGRLEADWWSGSNAPHLTDEPYLSQRTTRMIAFGATDELTAVDLERSGPGEYRVRRQVVHAGPDLWLVVDQTSGAPERHTQTVWTTSHRVEMEEGTLPGSFELTSDATDAVLTKFIVTSPGADVRRFRGDETRFLGWQVSAGVPRPAPAVVTRQPADGSFALTVWSLADGPAGGADAGDFVGAPSMGSWQGPESWTVLLPLRTGAVRISRESDRLQMMREGQPAPDRLALEKPALRDPESEAIRSAHAEAFSRYPKFTDDVSYRQKATLLCVSILLLQEGFFAVYRRHTRRYYAWVRALSVPAWVLLGTWLVTIKAPLIPIWTI